VDTPAHNSFKDLDMLPIPDGFRSLPDLTPDERSHLDATARDEEIDRVIGLEWSRRLSNQPFSMCEPGQVKALLRRVRLDRSEATGQVLRPGKPGFSNSKSTTRREVRLAGEVVALKQRIRAAIFLARTGGQSPPDQPGAPGGGISAAARTSCFTSAGCEKSA
jgi:DNA-binding response OmpR family regulator